MWPNPQETVDLVTFTEEILNGKFHFLCSDSSGFIIVVLFFAFFFLHKRKNKLLYQFTTQECKFF